ncbi:hypothetical protein CRE_22042 [Caenorhabditis remanei]|uniref:F-box domain-containing protein n=1 Tax=Caenorhabditis remanei TaxID=31234 RepID=E3N3I6_CAERE|nr:hypothetical protein CRE_22042 [Caenorhabditis remanei]
MSSPFPLLRLPRLALCEIFKSLRIGEKIKLSLCSKRISAQINNARLYSQKVIVDLAWSSQKIRVLSENHEDIFKISVRFNYEIVNKPNSIKIVKGRAVSVISYNKGVKEYWRNHQEGFLTAVRYLLKMFRCKISIDNSYYNIVQLQPVISELFDLQLEYKKLTIRLNRSEDHILLFNQISSSFEQVEDLTISSVSNPGFRPVFTSWPQKITIRNSYWFTVEYLLTCTCTTITLEKSYLRNKDLKVILKKWKAGGFPNLKCLTVSSPYFRDNGEQILGVIQTDDGSKKATLRTRGRGFEMSSHLGNNGLDVVLKNWKAGGFPSLKYMFVESQRITNNGVTILGMNLLELRGNVIQTDDGLKQAKIKTDHGRIEMFVTPL